MARKTIFLEMAFWEKFSECQRALWPFSDDENPMRTFEKSNRWREVFSFICRSNVFVDFPLSELGEKAKNDQFLMMLLKKNAGGNMGLEYIETTSHLLDSAKHCEYDDLSAVYLTKECHKIGARKHGVINICLDNIWEQHKKFIDSGEYVERGQVWAWEKLDVIKENSNSMVMIDNYLLSQDNYGKCRVDWNLKDILEQLLPSSLNEEYTISIFYYDKGESDQAVEDRKLKYLQIIDSHISRKKPNLRYKLELFPTLPNFKNHHKDFHDRTLITNNIWLTCEAGFDFLIKDHINNNYKASKETMTHGYYLGFGNDAAKWLEDAYEKRILAAKNCLSAYGYTTTNRLLI